MMAGFPGSALISSNGSKPSSDASGTLAAHRRSKLHGRRKGRPLSATRAALLDRRRRDLLLDLTAEPPADAADLFSIDLHGVVLEVGCGGGEHLVHEATSSPSTGYIGVEPFVEGLAKTVAAIDSGGCQNVRLFDGDAAELLDWLPAGTVNRVDILYPDPWPKRRHWKRRFISPANLDRIAHALVPGGELRVATDIPAYADWTLLTLADRSDFTWTAATADDWRMPWPGWPGTRYESKATAAGRTPIYLTFRRLPA